MLDVGCCGSPLTTAIRAMGFQKVHGIDLMPTPVNFPGIQFFSGDFLTAAELNPHYDIVIFCSSIEHFGLGGRYGAQDSNDYDLRALRKATDLLPAGGVLVLTVPYGVERTIAPWHRVYNKESKLLKQASANMDLKSESFFARVRKGHGLRAQRRKRLRSFRRRTATRWVCSVLLALSGALRNRDSVILYGLEYFDLLSNQELRIQGGESKARNRRSYA